MRKSILIIAVMLGLVGTKSIAQTSTPNAVRNQLTVEIIDVVDRKPLTDVTLIIANSYDTLNLQIDSVSPLIFELDYIGDYTTTVIKEGYDTLFIEWENPIDSAELLMEFFMPKTKLSRKEKRTAHYHSKRLPRDPCDNCGGFKAIRPSFNEMRVIRFRDLKPSSSSDYFEMRKLRFY